MKLCLKILATAVTAATTFSMVSCVAPSTFSYQNVSISLTSQCTDCPAGITFNPLYPVAPNNGSSTSGVIPPGAVLTMANAGEGGTIELLANVYNAPATNVSWQIYPQPNLGGITVLPTGTGTPVGESGSSVGSFSTPGTSPTTATGPNVYYAVNGVPTYSGQALAQAQAMGICQGCIMIVASVPSNPDNPGAVVTASLLIQIYNGSTAQGPPSAYLTPRTPSTPASLTNPVVSVAIAPTSANHTYQFYGGIVGSAPCLAIANCSFGSPPVSYGPLYSTDNTAVWEVGPSPFSLSTAFPCTSPGLACPFGTISSTGLYTAPAAIPPTPSGGIANEVVVVVVSQLVSTVDAYAYVALY